MLEINDIIKKWTKSMMYLSLALAIIFFVGEVLLYILLGPIVTMRSTLLKVTLKNAVNFVLIFIGYILVKNKKMSDYVKSGIPLALDFMICFNFVFNHYNYPTCIIALAIPVLLSILYTDEKLTFRVIWISIFLTVVSSIYVLVLNINDVGFYEDYVINLVICVGIILFLIFAASCMVKIENKRTQLLAESIRQRNYYYNQATIDELTKTNNRAAYTAKIKKIIAEKRKVTLAIVDIDKFKFVNDKYGHKSGDVVLNYLGNLLNKQNSETVYTARYGGEEFVILFIDQTPEKAKEVLEKLKTKLSNKKFKELDNNNVTFSGGIATCTEIDDETTLFNKADEALYKAKDTGRNKICIYKQ